MKTITPLLVLLTFALAAALPAKEASVPAKGPAAPQATDVGAADPEGFPRPEGSVRNSYSSDWRNRGQRFGEVATYHAQGDIDLTVKRSREQLAAAGWRAGYQSDSGSDLHRVVIDDWDRPGKDLEVRFYPARKGGTDLWVSMKTDATHAAAASDTPASGTAPASQPKSAGPANSPGTGVTSPAASAPSVTVPDLAGQDLQQAGAALDKAGLKLQVNPAKPVDDVTEAPGTVAEQTPAAGAKLATGATVTVTPWTADVLMPNLVGKPYTGAVDTLTQLNRGPRGTRRRITVTEGPAKVTTQLSQVLTVAAQTPAPGQPLPDGSTVTLTRWVPGAAMQNLVGQTRARAAEALAIMAHQANGVNCVLTAVEGPARPTTESRQAGTVAAQDPAAGQPVVSGGTVTLNYWVLSGPMPNLVGKSQADVSRALADLWTNGKRLIHATWGSPVPTQDARQNGLVAEQSPAAWQPAADGSTVTLRNYDTSAPAHVTVPKAAAAAGAAEAGPGSNAPLVIVPDLAGQDVTKAEVTLGQLGLKLQANPAKLRDGPNEMRNAVAAQTPAPGVKAARGSAVTVTPWSTDATMPKLEGKTRSVAAAILQQLGRGLTVNEGPGNPTSHHEQADTVAAQNPAAGQPLADGVTVTLSYWKQTGPVPNFIGKDRTGVDQVLQSLGRTSLIHTLTVTEGPETPTADGRQAGTVAQQDPPVNSMVMDGGTVTLSYWVIGGKMLNLVGMDRMHAQDALQQLDRGPGRKKRGLIVNEGQGRPTTRHEQAGTVAEQSPAAGQPLPDHSTVTLHYWKETGHLPNFVGKDHAGVDLAVQSLTQGSGSPVRTLTVTEDAGIATTDYRQAGIVAHQNPAADSPVMDGTTVTLSYWVIGDKMLNFVGMNKATVQQVLRQLDRGRRGGGKPRLTATEGPGKSTSHSEQAGIVAEQSPAPGQPAPDGSTVTLSYWMLTGPVPNFVGRDQPGVDFLLQSSALPQGGPKIALKVSNGPGNPTPDYRQGGIVAQQSPAANVWVPDGSTVTLNFWTFDGTMLNLVGKDQNSVNQVLDDLNARCHFRLHASWGPPVPTQDARQNGLVAEQSPAAGQKVTDGSTVTLRLYTGAMP